MFNIINMKDLYRNMFKVKNEAVHQMFLTFFYNRLCLCLMQKPLYGVKLIHLFPLPILKYNENGNGYFKASSHVICYFLPILP